MKYTIILSLHIIVYREGNKYRKKGCRVMDTKKTLRKMSKLELVELLAEQEREIQVLKQKLDEKEQFIEQRTIRLEEYGNIAQAALEINGIFEAAQRAADQYVESVKTLAKEQLQEDERGKNE